MVAITKKVSKKKGTSKVSKNTTKKTSRRKRRDGLEIVANRVRIPIDKISPNPVQPRRFFDPDEMKYLQDSMGEQGQEVDLVVYKHPDKEGCYEIEDGERRWRAAKAREQKTIKAIIVDRGGDRNKHFEHSVAKNFARVGHTALEKAQAMQRLRDDCGKTAEQIAAICACTPTNVYQHLSLLKLTEPVQKMMDPALPPHKQVTFALGLLIQQLPPEEQLPAAKKITQRKMSVREARHIIESHAAAKGHSFGRRDKPSTQYNKVLRFAERVAEEARLFVEKPGTPLSEILATKRQAEIQIVYNLLDQTIDDLTKLTGIVEDALA